MHKIKNFINSSSVNNSSIQGAKNEISSRGNCGLATLRALVTKKHNLNEDLNIENRLRIQIEQISCNGNLHKLINSEIKLEKALNFYKCLTPQILGNYTLISMFECIEIIYYYELFLSMLKDDIKTYFQELNGNFLKSHKYSDSQRSKKIFKKRAQMFMTLAQLFSTLSYYSKIFRKVFVVNQSNCILDVISDKKTLLDCINIINKNEFCSKEISNFLKNSIELINNLKKTMNIDITKMNKVCLTIMKLSKKNDPHLVTSYMFIAKYSSHLNTFNKNLFMDQLFLEIEIAVSSMNREKSFPIYFDSSRKASISVVSAEDLHLNLVELLDTLFFLMNENENEAFLLKNDIQRCMKTILMVGNDTEVEYAARILFQMSFLEEFEFEDDRILNIVKKIIVYNYPNKNLIRYCEGILWMTKRDTIIYKLDETSKNQNSKTKIFVCYDANNFESCLEYFNILKNSGFLVWFKKIDDYSMEQSILAIQSSDIVLLGKSLKVN